MAELRPIRCAACGAPVALAAASPTPCAHCGAPVDLPLVHVDLFAKLQRGAESLRMADAVWRTLPRTMPRGAPALFVVGLVATVAASMMAWVQLAGPLGLPPGRAFVFLVAFPSLVVLHLGLELLAYWSPLRRLELRFTASIDPRFPEVPLCRSCGAPLSVKKTDIVARCAYCDVDSLVRTLSLAAYRRANETAEHGRAQLDEGIANLRMLRDQRLMVRGLSLLMGGGVLATLLFALWNR